MQIRVYQDLRIVPAAASAFADVVVPQGNWRVVSLMALASVASTVGTVVANVVTTDVETVVALNQVDRLRATESGSVQPFISGGGLRATATKKVSMGDVFVRVVLTLEQS